MMRYEVDPAPQEREPADDAEEGRPLPHLVRRRRPREIGHEPLLRRPLTVSGRPMTKMTRRGALRAIGAGAALLGVGAAAGCGWGGSGMMTGGGMMGSASGADMSAYMDLFARHDEIRRTVEEIPGGVRTITESDAQDM